jgi:carbonic anhydrase/acetyltransferase-like protein (isoleucine patch superfamily)
MNDKEQTKEEENSLINAEVEKKEKDYAINFVTSSAINRISLKFLLLYIPILWFSGYMALAIFFDMSRLINNWLITALLIPVWLFVLYFIFVFGLAIFTRAILVIINMIHKPKEGIFKATEGCRDFEFWRLRTELKKLALWFMNKGPLPWIVPWGFRWFGVRIDFSSHLQDAWVDVDFIDFGRKVTVGQGAVVMSSMIVGQYLIIKKIIIDDYAVVGGVSNISPGTVFKRDTVVGAFSSTNFDQILDEGWIYFGIPAIKLKPNKYAEERRDKIIRRDVERQVKYEESHEINIDEDKKNLVNNNHKKEEI